MDAHDLAAALDGYAAPDLPLYAALADALEARILDGSLPAGVRLPSERAVATELSVSRGTVVRAYDVLRDRDRVHTRHGSGTVVGDCCVVRPLGTREARVVDALPWDGVFRGLLDLDRDAIDLRAAAWVGSEGLPEDAFVLAREDLAAVRDHHGYWPAGLDTLRAAVADDLTRGGLATRPSQVLITTGGQQAISLLAMMLLAPGEQVLVEELTYPGAINAFAAFEARLVALPLTAAGVDHVTLAREVDRRRPRLVYLVPSHHNPMGTVLAHGARRLVAEAVAGTDTVLIDDLALAEDWFVQAPPPPLASYDAAAAANVFTIGSLAKRFWGGLRLGYVRGTESAIARLARLKVAIDLGAPVVDQMIARRLLDRGPEVAELRRRELRRRYDAVTDALGRHLPAWSWAQPQGGLCLWVHLDGASSVEFARHAARRGVGVTPGHASSVTGEHAGYLRVPFGQRPDVLVDAVERLARAWTDHRAARGARSNVVV